MREILFRGKEFYTGDWVEGYYVKGTTRQGIVKSFACHPRYDVIPESVGQFTALYDKNGKRIFEGDIVVYRGDEYGVIEYDAEIARFCVTFDTWSTDFDHLYGKELEIIGNIHDNPKLLEGKI